MNFFFSFAFNQLKKKKINGWQLWLNVVVFVFFPQKNAIAAGREELGLGDDFDVDVPLTVERTGEALQV